MNAVYDGKAYRTDDRDRRRHHHSVWSSFFGRRSSDDGPDDGIQLHYAANPNDERLKVDPENSNPEERSSELKNDVAKRYIANKQWGVMAITFIQILIGAFVQSLLVEFTVTILPNVLVVAAPTPGSLLLQGFILFVAFLAAPKAAVHYAIDCLLLVLRMFIPLLTSDHKMCHSNDTYIDTPLSCALVNSLLSVSLSLSFRDLWMGRKHRGRDLILVWITTPPLIVACLGGWAAGSALVGWLNGSYSDIGNPGPSFDGNAIYDTYQVMGVVGTSVAFLYYTFGSSWIVSSNGHVKHIIDVLVDDEMPEDAQVFNYALFRSTMCVVNIALTKGSPVIFEQLISGAIINNSTQNIGYCQRSLLRHTHTPLKIPFTN